MDENEVNSNEEFYGKGAATSNVSPEDLALLDKANGVEVRDGDEMIDIPTEEEEENQEGNPEDKPEGEKKPVEAEKTVDEKVKDAASELKAVEKSLQDKGVDVTKIVESFQENGKFSPEDYSALEKAGYPKVVVDSIVRGQQAIAQEATSALFSVVGGEANFDAISQFAVENDKDSVDAFNEAYARGDMRTAKVVLQGLDRTYKEAQAKRVGTANKMISGQPGASKAAQAEGFANRAEMVKAMSDRRYAIDLKYTAEVEQRVARSTF